MSFFILTLAQFCIVLEVQYHIVVLEQQCTLVFLAVQEQWNILVLELVDNLVGEHCHIFVGVFVLEPIKIYPNLYLIIQLLCKNCDFKIILFWITYPTRQLGALSKREIFPYYLLTLFSRNGLTNSFFYLSWYTLTRLLWHLKRFKKEHFLLNIKKLQI